MANSAAKELWQQIFERAAALPNSAMAQEDADIESLEEEVVAAFRKAGWSDFEIEQLAAQHKARALLPNLNSPRVGKGLEAHLRQIAGKISRELRTMGIESHEKVELAIDPRIGIEAALTSVVMTDQSDVKSARLTHSAYLPSMKPLDSIHAAFTCKYEVCPFEQGASMYGLTRPQPPFISITSSCCLKKT